MKILKSLLFVFASIFLFIACQKEYSLETGNTGAYASGTLKDTTGNCLDRVVNGSYIVDSTLTDSNYISVEVNITTPGIYKISTDFQNGFSFKDSGYIATTGLQVIKLKGSGKPILPILTSFEVSFGTSVCLVTVNVTNSSGGTNTAAYTLSGGPGFCTNAVVQGTYTTGTQLNSSNKVIISVNVTTVGNYLINTGSVRGMTFIGAGSFTTTGLQTVTLQGGGTPTTAGSNVIPITAGSSTCSFTVAVLQGNGSGNNPNLSDSAWSFKQGALAPHGSFDYAFDTTIAGVGYAMVLNGSTTATGDSAITIAILFSGGSITTGTYNTNTFASFSYDDYSNGTSPVNIFTADNTTTGANIAIVITSYDVTTKTVTGTFSGSAKNKAGTIVPITAGKFKAQLQ